MDWKIDLNINLIYWLNIKVLYYNVRIYKIRDVLIMLLRKNNLRMIYNGEGEIN